MTRKILCALIALSVLCLSVSAFAAVEVPRAAKGYSTQSLERYDSFSSDPLTGEWRCDDPMLDAVADAVAAGEIRYNLNAGVLYWGFSLSGNAATGTLRPELVFYLMDSEPIGATAVSLRVRGARWDFEAACESAMFGGSPAEKLTVALGDGALRLIDSLKAADAVKVYVYGESEVYTADIERGADDSAKARLESASLESLSLSGALADLNIAGYALWDLSFAEWRERTGTEAAFAVADLSAATSYDAYLTSGDGLLLPGTRGDAQDALTALLREAGLYAGTSETTFGVKTIAAVRRAQRYYGLPVTGGADAALFARLNDGAVAEASAAPEILFDELSDARAHISRWWAARAVTAARSASALVSVSDDDNALVVCEGRLVNAGSEELGLGWQLTGALTIDGGAAYVCSVRVESDAGRAFSTTLLPGGDCRLIVTAEVPASALDGAETLELALSLNGATAAYTLSK